MFHFLDKVRVLFDILHHVGDIEDDVGIDNGAFREIKHIFLHLVTGFHDPRGIGKHDLEVLSVHDPLDPVTRGLGFGRDNR